MRRRKHFDMLKEAIKLAEFEFEVFPVHTPFFYNGHVECSCRKRENCEHIGKHPRPEHGLKEATTDINKIEDWWTKWPDANIGVRTGNGFFVLDIDPRHDGDKTLADLIDRYGPLPETMTVISGGGGNHYYFRNPENFSISSQNAFLPGLDIKGEGGYVIAPPSLHKSGKRYRWVEGKGPDEN